MVAEADTTSASSSKEEDTDNSHPGIIRTHTDSKHTADKVQLEEAVILRKLPEDLVVEISQLTKDVTVDVQHTTPDNFDKQTDRLITSLSITILILGLSRGLLLPAMVIHLKEVAHENHITTM